jgi:uracil-DNA glycosylase
VNDADTKLKRIQVLWENCDRCKLSKHRSNVVFWRGHSNPKFAVIGEAPGKMEDEEGEPFVGQSGEIFDSFCEKAGVEARDMFICNVIGCRPPGNRAPEADESEACRGRLSSMLYAVKPRALLLLGGAALTALTGVTKITQWRGKRLSVKIQIGNLEPIVFPAIATYHPAYYLRTKAPDIERDMVGDIRQVVELSQDGSYLEHD